MPHHLRGGVLQVRGVREPALGLPAPGRLTIAVDPYGCLTHMPVLRILMPSSGVTRTWFVSDTETNEGGMTPACPPSWFAAAEYDRCDADGGSRGG